MYILLENVFCPVDILNAFNMHSVRCLRTIGSIQEWIYHAMIRLIEKYAVAFGKVEEC